MRNHYPSMFRRRNTFFDLGRKRLPRYMPDKGEAYMSVKQRSYFRTVLESLRAEARREFDRTTHALQEDRGMAAALCSPERERELIAKIEQAIARLDEGEYGYCARCGAEIGFSRLAARPTATLCIDCKERGTRSFFEVTCTE